MMNSEEVVERVRKALYAATHALDEVQAEAAIRGVARMLAANLRPFNQVFAPFEPSNRAVETTRLMGEQIVELTRERGELQVTVTRQEATIARLEATVSDLTLKLAAPPQRRPALQRDPDDDEQDEQERRRPPAIIKKSLSATHRMVLRYIIASGANVTMRQLHERFALECPGLRSRLSELGNEFYFGGAVIIRHRDAESRNPRFEITAHGRALLAEGADARYQMSEPADQGGDDEHG